jgi:hypothetical protein
MFDYGKIPSPFVRAMRKLLARVTGARDAVETRGSSTLQSASLYLRRNSYYIHPLVGSGGGDPCLFSEPVSRLDGSATAIQVGVALLDALNLSHHDAVWPTDWKKFLAPFLLATGVKTESAFMSDAKAMRVDRGGDIIMLTFTTSNYTAKVATSERFELNYSDAPILGAQVIKMMNTPNQSFPIHA